MCSNATEEEVDKQLLEMEPEDPQTMTNLEVTTEEHKTMHVCHIMFQIPV